MKLTHESNSIPVLQVRDNCLVYYHRHEYNSPKSRRGIELDPLKKSEVFSREAYSGQVTKGVKKRMKSALDIFLQTTETHQVYNTVTGKHMDFRLGFATMTISDTCTWKADLCYTRLLKPFMRVMKNKYGVEKYIWKYELQNRGNVHYHVTWDVFVEHDKIRSTWNKEQKKWGLTDQYAKIYGHFNPNSTDIHKVWKIKNIGAYLGKYLTKNNNRVLCEHGGFQQVYFDRAVKGKVWDCSTDLKRGRFNVEVCAENQDRVAWYVEHGKAEIINNDNCTIIKCASPEKILTEEQKIDYMVWKYA